jgi:hypothetical protein
MRALLTIAAIAVLLVVDAIAFDGRHRQLLARHAREHRLAEGHACLANLAQGTVCKNLDQEDVKPHKVRYYLEQRDPDFAEKMAEVLCVYLAR